MTLAKRHFIATAVLCTALTSADIGVDRADAGDLTGQTMTWFGEDYPYLIVDQSLPDTLREFGHNLDIAIEVSDQIKGRVRRYDHEGPSGDFLNYLATEHGLDWVFDGGRLSISSAGERIARSWSSGADAYEAVRTALIKADIGDARYPVGFDSGKGEVNLSAPPRYMALAAPMIDRALAPKATRTVNVIHGRARSGGS
ncbi:MAG: hypothetical protein OEU92_34550 [Alphaproteobacteria bacterium]|nr:hypothetical protein [Alphaproteobacteria bacterium]